MARHAEAMTWVSSIRRILVVELWNIGDVVLLLPFLQQLRHIFPDASITLLGRGHARDLLAASGFVDEFIVADLNWQKDRSPTAKVRWGELSRVVRELRRKKFDIAFQCRPHVREYMLLALSDARRRVGIAKRGWDRLLTDRIAVDSLATQKKEAWLRLLARFGGARQLAEPRLRLAESTRARAAEFLRAHGVSGGELVVGIHPGASISEKRWPLDRFALVIQQIEVNRPELRPLVFVDPEGYGAELASSPRSIPARVDLDLMIGLLGRCDLLVCNDSGPMHIAAALGVTCVAVFGSGIDRMFAPLGEGHVAITPRTDNSSRDVLSPRYDVAEVPAEAVTAAVERVLG
jgi:ADP-heptose:LPS heptosyltransferase